MLNNLHIGIKIASKRKIQKTAEATGDWIDTKIVDNIIKV